jgi:hypothetical protein
MASTAPNPMVLHVYQATGRVSAWATGEHAAWKLPFACRSAMPQRSERRFGSRTLGLVRPVLVALALALVLGLAAAATAQESERSWEREAMASLGPEGLIAAWAAVFAALYMLYAYERARTPARSLSARHAVPEPELASDTTIARRLVALRGEAKPALASSRPLFASPPKAAAAGERPAEPAAGKRRGGRAKARAKATKAREKAPPAREKAAPAREKAAPAREKAATARERTGLGATQSGEETFRVVEAPSAGASTAPTASVERPDCAQRCATLRLQGRFEEAARVARDGLAVAGAPGLLLVELSRAEFGLGRVNAAIDTARDAHFASPSRESVVHLIRLLTETRRFTREDGPALRRAVSRHPRQPLLLYAAGVFESMHGKPCDAEKWLRAALPLAPDEEARRAIAGELSRIASVAHPTEKREPNA